MKNGTIPALTAEDADAEAGGVVGSQSGSSSCRQLVRSAAIMLTKVSVLVFAAGIVWYLLGWIFVIQLLLVAAVAYLAAGGGYRWFYVAFCTAPRDIKAVLRFVGLTLQVRSYQRKNATIGEIFQQRVAKHPQKICFLFEDEEWSFNDVEEYSNKVANVFKSHGYQKGDVVALMMENRPEFVCIWLGLSKLGITVPLINYNLRQHPLMHSIEASKCQAIIFGSEVRSAIKDVKSNLPHNMVLYEWTSSLNNETSELQEKNLPSLIAEAPSTPPPVQDKPNYHDALVYIYTSGTTGLPKAAVITHSRFIFIAAAMSWLSWFRSNDRFYMALPLYHTAGGVMSIGQALIFGSTVVIRRKFSASQYFPDIRKYDCTIAQYIGEMCRYVLAVPPKPEDKEHKLRMIFGNGLRPQIWTQFVNRFNIPRVAEFYGATEGNANIVNVDNTVGAIGFVSRIIPAVYPILIIRVNQETGEPIRDEKGLCIPCKPGEPGVFIGKINPNNPSRAFLGYVDKAASQKKIVYDISHKGDSAFISGDILVADEFGYLFFKDRTGDTFRWKGENVSTSEVEAVISNIINYRDSVVYGVEIRGLEGRAGMAAIVDEDGTLDLKVLAEGVMQCLPSYARPQFIRLLSKVDMTGTYKMKKKDLQEEGFNPIEVKDRLFYLTSGGTYDPLNEEVYNQILAGKVRF
ncbi:long-chain fatty acid transport protein 4 [Anabrus simplex]|uniref:long-chain fatty acid transport protein 4 n=1 Tax=Anabrus simplex TaxID=316456 RepID=UPI0034DD412E